MQNKSIVFEIEIDRVNKLAGLAWVVCASVATIAQESKAKKQDLKKLASGLIFSILQWLHRTVNPSRSSSFKQECNTLQTQDKCLNCWGQSAFYIILSGKASSFLPPQLLHTIHSLTLFTIPDRLTFCPLKKHGFLQLREFLHLLLHNPHAWLCIPCLGFTQAPCVFLVNWTGHVTTNFSKIFLFLKVRCGYLRLGFRNCHLVSIHHCCKHRSHFKRHWVQQLPNRQLAVSCHYTLCGPKSR